MSDNLDKINNLGSEKISFKQNSIKHMAWKKIVPFHKWEQYWLKLILKWFHLLKPFKEIPSSQKPNTVLKYPIFSLIAGSVTGHNMSCYGPRNCELRSYTAIKMSCLHPWSFWDLYIVVCQAYHAYWGKKGQPIVVHGDTCMRTNFQCREWKNGDGSARPRENEW